MRKKIVAGNWKMNKSFHAGIDLTKEIIAGLAAANHRADAVILCPPSLHIQKVSELCHGHSVIGTGAQNCHSENSGAFTGEISAGMIASVGANYVILGHSERRLYNGETDELLTKKVNVALMHGLKVIFCCGESVEIRNSNHHIAFVNQQLAASLFHLSAADMKNIVIAYEPIWAIGTGVTASKEQAQEMHAEIRKNLAIGFGDEVAENTSILYGGSCNAQNAKELFEQADVDGGLIGGASLKATDFIAIISSF